MEQMQTKHRTARGLLLGLLCLLSFIAFLCFFSAVWYRDVYGNTGFDSVLYTLTGGLGGVQTGLLINYLSGALLPAVLCTVGVALVLYLPRKREWMPPRRTANTISLVLSLVLVIHAAFNIGLVQFIFAKSQLSQLYETEYVDPNSVEITFPEEKRNLIYIYLESMETSYLDKDQGGAMAENLIPELTQLAKDNINFSHNDQVGGLVEVPGASWTVGAMVAHSAGVPLITPTNVDDWQNGYGKDGVFLPGLTSLNQILKEEGYNQALMVGSDANFGGRKTYFKTHGVDKIYDLYTAWSDGIVPSGYFEWWGIEDKYLFEYARQELTKMAAGDAPFAFTMLTVDTHHIGGYTCTLCGDDHAESYSNAIACSSKQVADFVDWIQDQPFYENTTVIITGDHFSMDSGYFDRNVEAGYVRHGYNCFLNAAATPVRTSHRQFSSLDMFPTTLAAMGCTVEGNKLGFGVNLFSDQQTMLEEFGYSAFCSELNKRTDYYEQFYGE